MIPSTAAISANTITIASKTAMGIPMIVITRMTMATAQTTAMVGIATSIANHPTSPQRMDFQKSAPIRATAYSSRSRTRRRQSHAKRRVRRNWTTVVKMPARAPSPMSPRIGSMPPCPLNGQQEEPTETFCPETVALSPVVVPPPTLTASPSTTPLSSIDTLPPTAVALPFTRPRTVMFPPIATTSPSITLPAGMTMSWPKRTRSFPPFSGGSGAFPSSASPSWTRTFARMECALFEAIDFPSSITRTEIPSSRDPSRGTLSVEAFDTVFAAAGAPDAGGAGRSSAARSRRRNEVAAIQETALVRTIMSERQANMAHTPFVATGWSQHDVERESQGNEDCAGHLNFRRLERDDRGAWNRLQRLHREPDLTRDRHVERDLVAEPLRSRGHPGDRGVDRGHDPDGGV